jgi:hypothetical protein
MAVIGVDDIPAAPYAVPSLSSIRLNVDREGYFIARRSPTHAVVSSRCKPRRTRLPSP